MTVDSDHDESGQAGKPRQGLREERRSPGWDEEERRSPGWDEEERRSPGTDGEEMETPIGRIPRRSRRHRRILDSDEEETEDEEEAEADGEDEEEETETAPTREELERLELNQALERLKNMCLVLGVPYKNKLLEMGVTCDEDVDIERVLEQIKFLQITLDSNYNKLKTAGKEFMREWELCNTPFKNMMAFAPIISVADSTTSADVVDAGFLSTLSLKKANDELKRLRNEREKAEKTEYLNEIKKLKDLVNENHLSWIDVGFEPKKAGVLVSYRQEINEIRKGIDTARELSIGRKELVFRVELVRQLIHQKGLPLAIIRGHLASAKTHVEKTTSGLLSKYDGEEVTALLEKLGQELDDWEYKQTEEEERIRTKTRACRTQPRDPPAA